MGVPLRILGAWTPPLQHGAPLAAQACLRQSKLSDGTSHDVGLMLAELQRLSKHARGWTLPTATERSAAAPAAVAAAACLLGDRGGAWE